MGLHGIREDVPMRLNGEERRRYPRSRRAVSAVIDHGSPGVLNHVDNISANGVMCHTVKPVPLMTKVGIAFNLNKDKRIECEGIVVRCEPDDKGDDHFKVAILYTNIDEADRRAISTFVDRDAKQSALDD